MSIAPSCSDFCVRTERVRREVERRAQELAERAIVLGPLPRLIDVYPHGPLPGGERVDGCVCRRCKGEG